MRLDLERLLRPRRQPYGSVPEAEHGLTSFFVVSHRRTAQGTTEVSPVTPTNHSLNDLRDGFAATANRGTPLVSDVGPLAELPSWPDSPALLAPFMCNSPSRNGLTRRCCTSPCVTMRPGSLGRQPPGIFPSPCPCWCPSRRTRSATATVGGLSMPGRTCAPIQRCF